MNYDDILNKYKDESGEIDWRELSKEEKLSEYFIREHQDKVDWTAISMYQKLSEDSIREFKDKVDWDCISEYQKINDEFAKEFNINNSVNKVIHNVGKNNNVIATYKYNPDIFYINGYPIENKEETLKYIKKSYPDEIEEYTNVINSFELKQSNKLKEEVEENNKYVFDIETNQQFEMETTDKEYIIRLPKDTKIKSKFRR